ncbi:MAG: phytanoyl-CoA dioxygenase family protein [Chloroflexota bacterium]|nr:phytanoyl-CoA dioxygenase family protein [Chloroflexota bacterium]
MSVATYGTTPETLSADTIQTYRQQGFVHVPGIISPEEVAEFRDASLALAERMQSFNANGIFTQLVNAWHEDETMQRLTMHPNIAGVAEKLAGIPLRLWHDQVLIKQPHNMKPTEYHQDQPLWPHDNTRTSISAWVALVDVPVERGCMTFIPGSQSRTDLAPMNLGRADSFFEDAPELVWQQRVTVPLRAGDCTFHNSRTLHMANDNATDEPRVAHIILMMDAETTYRPQGHPVTDPLNLKEGDPLTGEMFPRMTS